MVIVGLDVGYGNLKVAWSSHAHANSPQTALLPAGAGPIECLPELTNGARDLCGGLEVLVDGERWVAGVDSYRLENFAREHSDQYTHSRDWTALLHAALVLVGSRRVDILVAGLPTTDFQDKAKRAALKDRLEGVHNVRPDWQVEIARAVIVPQPHGAYADHLFSRAQAGKAPVTGDIVTLILDPGHYSTDWLIVENGSMRGRSSSSSLKAGRQILVEASRDLAAAQQRRVDPERLESAVRRKLPSLRVPGVGDVDYRPHLERAGAAVIEQVLKEVQASIGAQRDNIHEVLLAGGGAELFEPHVKQSLPKADLIMSASPVLANARGFWATGLGGRAHA
jgi:plasmid segregation protein ParM